MFPQLIVSLPPPISSQHQKLEHFNLVLLSPFLVVMGKVLKTRELLARSCSEIQEKIFCLQRDGTSHSVLNPASVHALIQAADPANSYHQQTVTSCLVSLLGPAHQGSIEDHKTKNIRSISFGSMPLDEAKSVLAKALGATTLRVVPSFTQSLWV